MDTYTREVLARMPLAEGVLLVWRWVADEQYLQELFERYRGRCYEKALSFPLMVRLVADAIVQYDGSGRRSFKQAQISGELETSLPAVYRKLGRLPVALSMGFLAGCTERLTELFPEPLPAELPKSLRDFEVVILDGKAIKGVAKRMKSLRTAKGGLLGGRALVAMRLRGGVALAMHAHPDGHANEARFLPELLPKVRGQIKGIVLWLGDRAFCNERQIQQFTAGSDHFLSRLRRNVAFQADAQVPVQTGTDASGRRYVQTWGWVGTARRPRGCYVRRIALERPGEEPLVLVTDLLDASRYPAQDLLDLYAGRWGIEQMFQQVTEVFGLQALIGSSPRATIFQLAFCLLLYNIIQLVRAYVAAAQKRPVQTISAEELFRDVDRELTAWRVLVDVEPTIEYLRCLSTLKQIRRRLHQVLDPRWSDLWIKSPARKRQPKSVAPASSRSHASVYRLLNGLGRKERMNK